MKNLKNLLVSVGKLAIENNDIIYVTFEQGIYVTLEDSKEIIEARNILRPNRKQLIIWDLTSDPVPDKDSKKIAFEPEVVSITKASAFIINSKISQIVGNFFISLNPGKYPTKLFTDKKEAEDWLLSVK